MQIPREIKYIMQYIFKNNYKVFIIGGAVRNSLLNIKIYDWDLVANTKPKNIINIFNNYKVIPTGLQHGTVTVIINNISVQITSMRKDGVYKDNRSPEEVFFTNSLKEDVARRDFTINSIAIDVNRNVYDYFGGLKDIENKIIRAVGKAEDRFNEDALRLIRCIRFSCQHDFTIEKNTFQAIIKNAYLIQMTSKERIRDELCKILMSDNPSKGIRLLQETGLLQYIIPELCDCVGFKQCNPNHDKDVFEHIISVLNNTPKILNVRLSALLHDIAKPKCFTLDDNGIGHFYYHHIEGEKLTEEILFRLKFDNKTINDVKILVREHMFNFSEKGKIKTSVIKKFMNRVGIDNLENLFCLRIADIKGSKNKDQNKIDNVMFLVGECHRIVSEKQPLTVKDLAINGKDLIDIGIQPGIKMGQILSDLLERVLDNPELNDKEMLLYLVKEKYSIKIINSEILMYQKLIESFN